MCAIFKREKKTAVNIIYLIYTVILIRNLNDFFKKQKIVVYIHKVF